MFQILSICREMEENGIVIKHFELGDPDFDTPKLISEAGIKSIQDGNTHYVNSRGDLNFIKGIQKTTQISRGFFPSSKQITVTTGANAGIFYTLKSICDSGDEILLPNPYFPTYLAACQIVGITPKFYSLKSSNNFIPNIKDIESSINTKTKAILINSPSNPTGAVFNRETIKAIYDLAYKNDLYVISDEVYARMIYENNIIFTSPGFFDSCRERTIIINGFSKTFAMTGWRVGVVIAPEDLSEKITLISESITSCVPGFIQDAALKALYSPTSITKEMYNEYRKRQLAICEQLLRIEGVNCPVPKGGMYVFPYFDKLKDKSEKFAMHLLKEKHIACVPGIYFGSQGESHLRFSCAGKGNDIDGLGECLNDALKSF